MSTKKRKRVNLPPGTIVFTGEQKTEQIQLHYTAYDKDRHSTESLTNHDLKELHTPDSTLLQWYDLRGLHDTALLQALGHTFNIHPLVMEDVADTTQRPKFDEYADGNFMSLRALQFDEVTRKVHIEQVSVYFGDGFLLSFQENPSDLFASVRRRIEESRGRIRDRGADYLCYALVDCIVDNYFLQLDKIESFITDLEGLLQEDVNKVSKNEIHQLKRQMLTLRRSIAPLREAIGQFSKSESDLVEERTVVFLRDLYDHTIQVMDFVETYRDMLTSLQDLYLSEISFQMNQVMQVLTIITTIFVPLSFLAGLYGMNFDNMPELHYRYGYFILLGIMLLIAVVLLGWFKQKRWL